MMQDNTYDMLNQVLESDGSVRFAGIVDKKGRLIVHGYKKGLAPMLSEKEVERSIVQAILKMSTDQSMEERLGRVEYSMTVYENVKRITVPIKRHDLLLLISAERTSDHEKIMQKVLPLIDAMH
ncbi:MAG: hypothetical protein ACREAY_03510 [Nitrososphaera sp.]|uniref:hypothetical protein n=1 Tax=Nitrososphaera sp. TaxID=1971748 RepID=UPI003D6F4C99